jgi:hypothetical protein
MNSSATIANDVGEFDASVLIGFPFRSHLLDKISVSSFWLVVVAVDDDDAWFCRRFRCRNNFRRAMYD